MFKYHVLALLLGTILDFCFGRIYSIWNPFSTIKDWISYLDRALLGDEIILLEPSKQRTLGGWLVFLTLLPVLILISFFTMLCYDIAPWVGVLFEAFASYLCLNGHYLFYGARSVMTDYYGEGMSAMNYSASVFMKQDVEEETPEKTTEAVITYLANEATDAVLSPLFVMFLFGPVGGFLYRTIDLIDGRIGHKNIRYEHFGYLAAKINSLVDYLPGRFNGALTVFAARHTFGDFNGKNAKYIHLRDRNKAISAYAGALEISLKDGTIGDSDIIPEPKDIRRATNLLRNTFIIYQVFLLFLLVFF